MNIPISIAILLSPTTFPVPDLPPEKPMIEAASPAPAAAEPETPEPASAVADPSGTEEQKAEKTEQHDIVVRARTHVPGDPLQAINAKSFEITQKVDKAVVGPVAFAFDSIVPVPVMMGFGNALNNLREPDVFLNFLLQHKIGKAAETFARFAINSTIGIAGIFDFAKRRPFKLPRRPNGFSNTFGFYGVKQGPFFFLPIVGPTTLRDMVGGSLDKAILPFAVGKPFNQLVYTIPTGLASSLDRRVKFDDQLQAFREQSSDPYAARRDFYLHKRQAEIDHLHMHGK